MLEEKNKSLYKKIILDNFALMLQYFFGGISVFIVSPMIVKSIGLIQFGKISVMLSAMTYIALIIQYSFNMVGPKLIADNQECKRDIFNQIFFAKLFIAIACFSICFIYYLYDEIDYPKYYYFLLLMPISWVFNSAWFLQSIGNFLHSCFCSILASLITLLIAFLYVSGERNAIVYSILCLVLSSIINGILTYILALNKIKKFKFMNPVRVIRTGSSLFLSQIISSVYTMSGVFIITYFHGVESGGVYAIVERFMNLIIALALLTHIAAFPKLANLYRVDPNSYWSLLRFIVIIYTVLSVIVFVFTYIFIVPIQIYMFGVITGNSAFVIFSACIYICLAVYGPIITGLLTLQGRGKFIVMLNIFVAIISLACGYFSLEKFGSAGWLIGLSIAQVTYLLLFLKISRNKKCVA